MSLLWGEAKKYSSAVFGIPGTIVAGVAAAGGAVIGEGGLGLVTVETIATTEVTVGVAGSSAAPTITTTITTSSGAASGAVVAGTIAVGFAGGTLIGQGLNWVIASFWDPVKSLHTDSRKFTSATVFEIDEFINEVIETITFYPLNFPSYPNLPLGSQFLSQTSMKKPFTNRLLALDQVYPELGSKTLRFLRAGIKAFVDAVQGAALATAGLKAELENAAGALQDDIKDYIPAIKMFAEAIACRSELSNIVPSLSIDQHLRFLERNRTEGPSALSRN